MIEAYEYDPNMRVLHVKFRTGGVYAFQDVPPDVATQFAEAPSMGKFFHNKIREQYRAL